MMYKVKTNSTTKKFKRKAHPMSSSEFRGLYIYDNNN